MPEAGRVIAGSARGLRLRGAGAGTRPLTDRVKEVLFGILEAGTIAPWPTAFLDLYAGSGAGAVEALSRGAPAATLVERDRGASQAIAENLARAGFGARAQLRAEEVTRFLEGDAAAGGGPFGAVLLDPPYGDATLLPSLERLADAGRGWLEEEAVVVAKHFWRDQPPERVGDLELARQRRFGETALSFYRRTRA
ncbi:MAG: 16S rRNA (guanine(966)-N(2))-methyltransferase RsmD [Candidatus Limnocylindrales bacterium]